MPLPGRGVNDPRSAPQRILRVRRSYNQFVADETLEDYALRFTAKSARRFTPMQIAMTALGGISFLALEAIGGTVTLSCVGAGALNAAAFTPPNSTAVARARLRPCSFAFVPATPVPGSKWLG